MTANNFAKLVKIGSEKLRVDDVIIHTGDKEHRGRGTICIHAERFRLEITPNDGDSLPQQKFGVLTLKDRWKITGIIEDCINFSCNNVFPNYSHSFFGRTETDGSQFQRHKLSFSIDSIDLTPTGLDKLDHVERSAFVKKLENEALNRTPTNEIADEMKEPAADTVCFDASFAGFSFFSSTWEGSTNGAIDDFNFEISAKNSDAESTIHLMSKDGHTSLGHEKDWIMFYGFMNALSFIHGTHAWPYRVQYWRAGRKITDRLRPVSHLARTAHRPFPETFDVSAKTGSLTWSYPEVIQKATKFFQANTPLSMEVAHLLFLFREATKKGVHGEIKTIALCVLFENLFQSIFKELNLKPTGLGQSRSVSAEHKLETVVRHLGLTWENEMQTLFKTWRDARNPLVHLREYSKRSDDEVGESFYAESRVAGAFNILCLKLFGYSGLMCSSAFEQKCRMI